MKITLESTSQIVTLIGARSGGPDIAARVWVGETERGVKIQCLIPRIAAQADQDLSQFDAELQEMAAPRAEPQAFPLRMLI